VLCRSVKLTQVYVSQKCKKILYWLSPWDFFRAQHAPKLFPARLRRSQPPDRLERRHSYGPTHSPFPRRLQRLSLVNLLRLAVEYRRRQGRPPRRLLVKRISCHR